MLKEVIESYISFTDTFIRRSPYGRRFKPNLGRFQVPGKPRRGETAQALIDLHRLFQRNVVRQCMKAGIARRSTQMNAKAAGFGVSRERWLSPEAVTSASPRRVLALEHASIGWELRPRPGRRRGFVHYPPLRADPYAPTFPAHRGAQSVGHHIWSISRIVRLCDFRRSPA